MKTTRRISTELNMSFRSTGDDIRASCVAFNNYKSPIKKKTTCYVINSNANNAISFIYTVTF